MHNFTPDDVVCDERESVDSGCGLTATCREGVIAEDHYGLCEPCRTCGALCTEPHGQSQDPETKEWAVTCDA